MALGCSWAQETASGRRAQACPGPAQRGSALPAVGVSPRPTFTDGDIPDISRVCRMGPCPGRVDREAADQTPNHPKPWPAGLGKVRRGMG